MFLFILLQLLLALRHPNVVYCKEAFRQDSMLYIVLEHCSEGETLLLVLLSLPNTMNGIINDIHYFYHMRCIYSGFMSSR